MKSFYHPLTVISTMGVMLCTLTSPAIAQEIWYRGGGKIISGPGMGGNVTLTITKNGRRVTFRSGPDRGITRTLNSSKTVQTNNGKLKFVSCDSKKLCVTFTQNKPGRVIRYLLTKL